MSVPLSRPPVDDEIKAAVLAAIDSRQYILGPESKAFEQEFARYTGSKHAVLTSSATAAIWMALNSAARTNSLSFDTNSFLSCNQILANTPCWRAALSARRIQFTHANSAR